MDEGRRILEWIRDNGHTVKSIASKIGYSRSALSTALHKDRISPQLADAFYEHFWLRVSASTAPQDASTQSPGRAKTGRPPGPLKIPRQSKLDAHAHEIAALLKQGITQSQIAKQYNTSDSNLHEWMRRHDLWRDRADE